jgi:hypothetical protein
VPELPAQVLIRCTADDEPLAGAFATLRVPMWSKNQYMLVFGPTDSEGLIRVSGSELAARARAELDAFPMDYTTFPGDWTGGLGVEVLDATGVHRLREAIGLWGEQFYPPDFADTLDGYEQRLRALEGRRLQAEIARTD